MKKLDRTGHVVVAKIVLVLRSRTMVNWYHDWSPPPYAFCLQLPPPPLLPRPSNLIQFLLFYGRLPSQKYGSFLGSIKVSVLFNDCQYPYVRWKNPLNFVKWAGICFSFAICGPLPQIPKIIFFSVVNKILNPILERMDEKNFGGKEIWKSSWA